MRKAALLFALIAVTLGAPALAQQPAPRPRWCAKASPRSSRATSGPYPTAAPRWCRTSASSSARRPCWSSTPAWERATRETVLREVAKVGAGKPIYIVTTHVHPEHDMGAHAFPKDSKLIRSKDQIEDIAAGAGMNLVPVFAQRSALNVELLEGAKHRDADIVFDRDYTLDLGGIKAKIYAMGTNHTHGDTVDPGRRRAVLGRRGHAPATVVRESHREDQPLAGEPRPARGA